MLPKLLGNAGKCDTFWTKVPRILPDRDIAALLGNVILEGTQDCVGPSSYEVRLGNRAKFHSTGEEVEIRPGFFLEIEPGELVTVASLEKLDFSRTTLDKIGKPGIIGFITPTTTMMREGFLFASTKVDTGFRGTLNWGIRNSSIKAVQLSYGERIFKLTLFELQADEVPDKVYGDDKGKDLYQGSEGIVASARMIPVQIADSKLIRRNEKKIDPKRQLLEAGAPFNYIGTELRVLQGNFEIVSKDVALVKEGFDDLQKSIEKKIDDESNALSTTIAGLPDKIDTKIRATFSEQFGLYFDQRMQSVYSTVGTIVAFALALYKLVIASTSATFQGYVLLAIGAMLALLTLFLMRSKARKPVQ